MATAMATRSALPLAAGSASALQSVAPKALSQEKE
jgi:hypothetical protein